MSEAVDTRIVEAKFDSSDFEKGVDKTVKKLDELKKSLNLKDSETSVTDLTSKIKEATDKASSSLEKLENRMTSFVGMLKNKIISGIADDIVGMFMNIKHGFESLIHSLSGAQISSGMRRYTDILTSVRTLVSAGANQDAAYESIERLGLYADQTSFSLEQLVSVMSKFRTAGADLKTAERMAIGLSNAAASMGVNTEAAQRAYYNMQQAYSKGYMSYADWKSFELMPMVGEKFNQAILDAAVARGTLEKQKDGTYKTTKKTDKQVKTSGEDSKGITAQNMGQKLSSRWFNKEVMEEVFGSTYYFSEMDNSVIKEIKKFEREKKKLLKEGKITQEQYDQLMDDYFETMHQERFGKGKSELDKQLEEGIITAEQYKEALDELEKSTHLTRFGYEAFRAGQEARSFSDAMKYLKDVISRGWAQSFEIIFGRLDEAAEFFTGIADSHLFELIGSIGSFRNNVLEAWSESGGRDDLIEALKTIDEILSEIFGHFTIFTDDMDDEDYNGRVTKLGHTLSQMSLDFKRMVNSFRDWLHETDRYGVSRIDRITKAFNTLGSVLGIVFRAISFGFKVISSVYTVVEPILDALVNSISRITTSITEAANPKTGGAGLFKSLENGLDNLMIIAKPVADVLSTLVDVLGEVLGFFVDIAAGNFGYKLSFITDSLGFILELFGVQSAQQKEGMGVLETIKLDIIALGDACKEALSAVNGFFDSIIMDLRELFGIGVERKEGTIFDNVIKFFETNEFVSKVKSWITNAFNDIGNFIASIPQRVLSIGDFITGLFWEKEDPEKMQSLRTAKEAKEYKESLKKPLLLWIENAWAAVKEFIKSIPERIKKIPSIIGEFIRSLLYRPAEKGKIFRNAKEAKEYAETLETPLKKFLDTIIGAVQNFIKDLPKNVTKAIEAVGGFFRAIIQGIFGTSNSGNGFIGYLNETGVAKDIEIAIESPFKYVSLNGIIDTIRGWGRTIFNQFISIFTGTDEIEYNISWFSNKLASWIGWIKERADFAWKKVKDWFISLPTTIANLFRGNNDTNESSNSVISAIYDFAVEIANKIAEIPTILEAFWNEAKPELRKLWVNIKDAILSALTGDTKKKNKDDKNDITSAIEAFVANITNFISKIPDEILTIWEKDVEPFIGKVWDAIRSSILKAVTGKGSPSVFDEVVYQNLLKSGRVEDAEKYRKQFESNPIFKNISAFITHLITYLGEKLKHLPEGIIKGLNWGTEVFTGLLEKVTKWFEENTNKSVEEMAEDLKKDGEIHPILAALISFGDTLKNLITVTIPGFFVSGFNWIVNNGASIWGAIKNIFGSEGAANGVDQGIDELGKKIEEAIKKIPEYIHRAIEWVKNLFKKKSVKELNASITDGSLFTQKPLRSKRSQNPFLSESDKRTLQSDFKAAQYEVGSLYKEYERTGIVQYYEDQDNYSVFPSIITGLLGDTDRSSFDFWELVKTIGTVVKDVFVEIVPYVIEGINLLLDKIGGVLGWFGDLFKERDKNEAIGDSITKKLEEEGNEEYKPLVNAFTKLGTTIWGIITDVLPKFISGAFEEVAAAIPNLLGSIFGGEEMQNRAGDAVAKSLSMYGPDTSSGKKKGGGLLDLIVGSAYADEADVGWVSGAEEALNNEQDVLDAVVKTESKRYVSREYALEKLKAARDEFRRKYGKAAGDTGLPEDALDIAYNGDYWAEMEKYKKDIWEVEYNIGDGISDIPLDELNNTLKTDVSFSDADAKKSKENTDNIVDSGMHLLNRLTDLADAPTTKIAAVILGLAWLFHEMKVLFSPAYLIEAPGYTAKWVGLTVLISGLVAMVGYLTYLASIGDDAKLAKVEGILEKLGNFIKEITLLIGAIETIKTAGLFFSWRGSKADKAANLATKSAGSTFIAGLGKTAATIGLIGFGIDFFGNVLRGLVGDISIAFEYLRTGIDALDDATKNIPEISKRLENIEETFIMPVGQLIYQLTQLFENTDPEQKYHDLEGAEISYKQAFDLVMILLTEFSGTIEMLKEALTVDASIDTESVINSLERIMDMKDKFKEFAEFASDPEFEDFKYGLASLSSVLSMYTGNGLKYALNDEQVNTAIENILKVLKNEKLQEFINTITKDLEIPDGKETYKITESITMLATGIANIGNAGRKLTGSTGENINKLFKVISELDLPDAEDTEGATKIARFSQNMSTLGTAMGTFASKVNKFSPENLSVAKDVVDMVIMLGWSISSGLTQSELDKTIHGDKSLSAFGLELATFSDNLATFMTNVASIDQTYNENSLNLALKAFNSIALTYAEMNHFTNNRQFTFADMTTGLADFAAGVVEAVGIFANPENNALDDTKVFTRVTRMFHFLDRLSKFAMESKGVYFSTEMADLADGLGTFVRKMILNGVYENGKITGEPVTPFHILAQVMESVSNKFSEVGDIDGSKLYKLLDAYGSFFESLAAFYEHMEKAETADRAGAQWEYYNPNDSFIAKKVYSLSAAFNIINDYWPEISETINKIGTMKDEDLTKAQNLMNFLTGLGNILMTFSESNAGFTMNDMQLFDWPGFIEHFKELVNVALTDDSSEPLKPIITPVIEINDDFLTKANLIHQMLGSDVSYMFGKDGEIVANQNVNTSLDLASGITIPEPKDYSLVLDEIKTGVYGFKNDLSSMRFVINGKEFVDIIGPDIDNYQNYEMTTRFER